MKKVTKDYVYSHLSPFERSNEPGREGKANAAFFELMKRQWGDQMNNETKTNLEKVGEKFHQSFDVDKGEARKMDTKEIILEESIAQKSKYKETVSTLPMPLERSQLSSQKGTKTLEIKSFV